jgi:hypothetical protein
MVIVCPPWTLKKAVLTESLPRYSV